MNSNLKIPSPWAQLAVLFGLAGGGAILAALVLHLIPGMPAQGIPQTPGLIKLAQAIGSICLFGVPSIAFAFLVFRKHPMATLGFRPAMKNSFYLVAVLLLLFSFPLEGWLGLLNKKLPLAPWMVQMEKDNDKLLTSILQTKKPFDVAINLLVVAVLPGILEEICFRGVLQRIIIQIFKNPWAGIIVTGLLFSALHFEFEGFLPRALLGIVLGAIYWYSRSLWTVILAHAFFNGIQVVEAYWYPQALSENPSVPVYSALVSLIIIVGLLVYMRRRSTITYAQVYEQ